MYPACEKHPVKEIEFFCQGKSDLSNRVECKEMVCSKCMFYDHNGHKLSLVDDAFLLFKTNM